MSMVNITPAVFGRIVCENRIFPDRSAGVNRLYYVNNGEMLLKSGQNEIIMKQGYLYLLPHNHVNTITTEYVDHTFFNFYSLPQISNENVIEIKLSEFAILESAFDALNLYVENNCSRDILSKDDPRRAFVGSFLENILFLINEISKIHTVNDELVNEAIEYIQKNFKSEISVAELARRFHMEQNSFIRRFKKHANVTPYQYLIRVRVNVALALMKGDKYDLEEIAKMVGYSDASTLSHAIKKCITVGYVPQK